MDIEKESSEISKEYKCQGITGNVYKEKNHQKLQETKILPILEGKPLARSCINHSLEGRVTQNWLQQDPSTSCPAVHMGHLQSHTENQGSSACLGSSGLPWFTDPRPFSKS